MNYKPMIGLEIHLELNTNSKMFCDSPNDPNEKHPNINICPICMAHPGTLPTINKEAVKKVLLVGLALNGEIAKYSHFDRKNYFYPDLPKGYQISQYQHPLIKGGGMVLKSGKKIRIRRIHLEEETAKLIHAKDGTLIDFNRAGIPLMELVTEPDFTSSEEVGEFAEEFHLLARIINISDADMEKGEMRIEANVSLSQSANRESFGTKVEIKNINSFKAVREAIDYEISRQTEVLKSGGKITHETRGWDEDCRETVVQRLKEEAHDYRYFQEPDLLPLDLTKIEEFNKERLYAEIPETPAQKRGRLQKEYKLKEETIEIFVKDKKIADFFEKTVSELFEWAKDENKEKLLILASNYLVSDLLGFAKQKEIPFDELLVTPENFAELLKMIVKNEITSRTAKDVLLKMVEKGGDASEIVEESGLRQVADEESLKKIVEEVISDYPQAAADYKGGKGQSLQFLIGKVMAKTRGKANPKILEEIFKKELS